MKARTRRQTVSLFGFNWECACWVAQILCHSIQVHRWLWNCWGHWFWDEFTVKHLPAMQKTWVQISELPFLIRSCIKFQAFDLVKDLLASRKWSDSGLCLSPLPASLSTVCSPNTIHNSWVQNMHSIKLKQTDKMLWNEVLVTQSCLTLCNPMDCSPPGSAVHGILQERILEWVAIPFSREFSWHRVRTWVSCLAGRFFTIWAHHGSPDLKSCNFNLLSTDYKVS